ncbi:MAG: energy transducer TonB [Bacteroidota bacterium]
MRVSPHLGRVSYGAGELRRVYVKHMTLAFILSIALTLALLNSLWLLVDQEAFNPNPRRVVHIFKYSEIELPRPLGDVEFGLSAYPTLQQDISPDVLDASLPANPLRNQSSAKKRNPPKERQLGEGLNTLSEFGGAEKLPSDEKDVRQNIWSNKNAPSDRDDISGGSGESREPWRKGGTPVPGKTGEPPSGVDPSGIGGSSKPSAEGTPYGFGYGGNGDGEGDGGFSMRWLQGMTRRKISGELPKYPPGTNVSAQVKILTIVLPDGTVKSVQPTQKANRLLEEAAMKAVQYWKFESLGLSLSQVEQSCVITFYFKLK